MNGGAAQVVLYPQSFTQVLHFTRDRIGEENQKRRPHRGVRRQAWMLNGLEHEKVEVAHVREMLSVSHGVLQGTGTSPHQVPEIRLLVDMVSIHECRMVETCTKDIPPSDQQLFST